MFDKINGPTNPMAGPAQGHSTEQGDSWHTAVAKINAAFKNFKAAIEGGVFADAPDDAALGERLSKIEDVLAALQSKVDALTLPQTAPETARVADVKPPETPPTETPPPTPAPIADVSAAKPETAIPVTTNSTFIGAGGPAA